MDALSVLNRTFGHSNFRSVQKEVVEHVIDGHNALVLMPTGGGKSLCYQIPALVRAGTGLVVSPLIALMQEQVAFLREAGVNAAYLNSTLDYADVTRTEQALVRGELDVLYLAPERLLRPQTLSLLKRASIGLFAVDEAHCVSQWGHDFRPEYLRLREVFQHFPDVPIIALTATADAATRAEILAKLALQPARIFVTGFDRPNINYTITEKTDARRQLLRFIQRHHWGDAGIVYCARRNEVDQMCQWLQSQGIAAVPYHAGLETVERNRNQMRFVREEGIVVVATIAFGMGIDKPNVRFVAHIGLPRSLEAYYQETGRAGRDGLPANAWMIYNISDLIRQRDLINASESSPERKQVEWRKLDALMGLCETAVCRRVPLLNYFGEAYSGPCNRCDNCRNPGATWDATEAARKALSCVYRVNQRFGAAHVVDVLRGADTEKVRVFGHDRLSTYGIGKDLEGRRWRAVLRQLLATGLLSTDSEGHGTLRLTEKAKPVLRGEQTVFMRPLAEEAPKKETTTKSGSSLESQVDTALFQLLRAKRLDLAQKQGIPPYVIFHDVTLRTMADIKPQTLEEFARLPGVGEVKLRRYGELFLDLLQKHVSPRDSSGEKLAAAK